jgi:8-oxo-dGTP diphosphatase
VTARRRIEVVAAVLERADGCFLLAQRPPGKVYEGYWEFPGGKVELGESPAAALARELHEELGIDIGGAYPWLTRDYDYEHAAVKLRFLRVRQWEGELQGREGQAFAWQHIDRLTVAPLLPANGPILRALALPYVYGISNAASVGPGEFLQRLERALHDGLRIVQVREPQLAIDELASFATRVITLARRHRARVLINTDPALAVAMGADGVHLTAARLMSTPKRPECDLAGASCHDARELERAAELGLDYVLVGPVEPTASHPGAPVLGWGRFSALIADYPLPVYAIGGLAQGALPRAWGAGAHGIAAIRGVFPAV